MQFRATCAVVLAAFVLLLSCATAMCDVRCGLTALSGGCHPANPAGAMDTGMAMANHAEAARSASRHTSPDVASIMTHAATPCLHQSAPALLNGQDEQSHRLPVGLSEAPSTLAAMTLPPPEILPAHAIPLARSAPPPFASSAVLRV